MKIRNESKRTYFFNGGCIQPNEVCDIKDEAIATALIINYPTEIICLDKLEVRVVEAEAPDDKSTKKKAKKKSKTAEVSKVEVKIN